MRINRAEFLAKLETLSPGLSPQEVIEQSSCIVFRGKYCHTFNDEIGVRARSPLEINGAAAAGPLLNLLRKMSEDEIEISAPTGTELLVAGKHREAGIRMESAVTLPIETIETPDAWKPLHAEFCEAVSVVEQCAGKDDSKFYLTCIHLAPKWIEACDNLQATRYNLTTGLKKSTLVRRDSIRHIAAMGMTEFAETETWLHFRNPQRTILSIRRFAEDYPSLDEILSVSGEPTQLPRGLADAAEKADVFAAQNADAESIMLSLKPGKLVVTAESALGWYRETKSVKYSGNPLAFLIVPKILTAIVRKHSSCVVTRERLKVDGGKFVYVTVLGKPDSISKERHDHGRNRRADQKETSEKEGGETRRSRREKREKE